MEIAIGSFRYRFSSNEQDGWIEERSDSSQSNYKITFMLGGKNMLIFLTPLEKGRMQILPLAYNIHEKKWFDNSAGIASAWHASGLWQIGLEKPLKHFQYNLFRMPYQQPDLIL